MNLILLIALGGAAGAVARYGVEGLVQAWTGSGFPWGTLTVNVIGSVLLGLSIRLLEATAAPPELRALVTVGLLGAFTTFSTFSYETVALLQDGQWGRAAFYAAGSLIFGLAGILAGFALAALALQPRG